MVVLLGLKSAETLGEMMPIVAVSAILVGVVPWLLLVPLRGASRPLPEAIEQ
jgi:hypothetical protein